MKQCGISRIRNASCDRSLSSPPSRRIRPRSYSSALFGASRDRGLREFRLPCRRFPGLLEVEDLFPLMLNQKRTCRIGRRQRHFDFRPHVPIDWKVSGCFVFRGLLLKLDPQRVPVNHLAANFSNLTFASSSVICDHKRQPGVGWQRTSDFAVLLMQNHTFPNIIGIGNREVRNVNTSLGSWRAPNRKPRRSQLNSLLIVASASPQAPRLRRYSFRSLVPMLDARFCPKNGLRCLSILFSVSSVLPRLLSL